VADSAGRGYDIPRTISHYSVGDAIGGGGMGTVYRGMDRRDDSPVAIKLLHPHLAEDESFRERFEREAHVGALMRSPYVVRLLDYGFAEGRYYIVMEYVEGSNLKQEIARGPLAPLRAVKIAAQVGRALEEAEARGVVHRDIKPDNILLTQGDHVKVADFGIAKQLSAGTLTMPGAFVGTLYYAAPELALGRADHRSDVYSLGATLFHALTGHPPFRGDALEVLRHHSETPIPMEELAEAPEMVREIIEKCLQKDPEARYQTTNLLAGDLEKASSRLAQEQKQTETVAAPPPTVVAPPPEQLIAPTEVSSAPPAPVAPAPEPEPELAAPAPPPITTGQSQGGGPARPVPQVRRSGIPSWIPAAGGVLAVGGLALAALLFLSNVGGGDDDGGSGREEHETIGREGLRRMLLPQFDLGPEFTAFALNPDASGYVSAGIPGAACARQGTATPPPAPIESYNNQYEYEAGLAVESGTFILVEAVDNHPDEDASGEALDDFIADPASVMTMPGCPENEILSDESFEPEGLSGDATGVEQRIKQTDSEGESREFSLTVIGLTRETILGKVLIAYFEGPATPEQQRTTATNIAVQLDARIKEVLAANASPTATPKASRSPSGSPGETPAPTDTPGPGETAPPEATQGGPGAPIISALGCSPSAAQTGQTVSCSPSIAGGVTSRSWSAGGGSPGSGSGATFSTSFASAGPKSISLTVCNAGGCNILSQEISVLSPVTAGPSAPTINGLGCTPSNVQTEQTVNCSPSVNGSVSSYGWSASGGSPSSGSAGSFSTSYASAGSKSISLTVCNASGCNILSQGVTVSEPQAIGYDVTISSATVFFGDTVTVYLYADTPSSGLGFYDIDVEYDPNILTPIGCDDFYGTCDPFFFEDTVNFNGFAGDSGALTIGSITFSTFNTGFSGLTVLLYTFQDIAGNEVFDVAINDGSVLVQ